MVCPRPFDSEGQSSAMPGSPMKSRVQSPAPSVPALSSPGFWILVVGTLAVLFAGSTRAVAQSANSYYKQGQAAEARDDFDTAFQDFQKPLFDPKARLHPLDFHLIHRVVICYQGTMITIAVPENDRSIPELVLGAERRRHA